MKGSDSRVHKERGKGNIGGFHCSEHMARLTPEGYIERLPQQGSHGRGQIARLMSDSFVAVNPWPGLHQRGTLKGAHGRVHMERGKWPD